ncbi:hypothetical protein BDN71DRAFT_1505286 [Pleurotus eryngii]|uniref:Uncharacterized protein n=1 Tax=Pleurotus eryngii TaxID=5323 RepID=A0A9P5ZYV3_PLEER|nr:hypothetical protein BDN71DRAFT_1505286 [Pleurotus eryngii]
MSFVTHTLHDPSNIAIENGHLYYLFVQHLGFRGLDPHYPHAHYPTASTLGLTQSPPHLRYTITALPTKDLDIVSIVEEPEEDECADNEESDENNELQYPDDVLDSSDDENISTQAQYTSSNVSESQDVEPTLDSQEPHIDIPYVSSINKQLDNPHIMYYPSPRLPISPLPVLTLAKDVNQMQTEVIVISDDTDSGNELDSSCMQYPRSFKTRASELYGSKILLNDEDIAYSTVSEYDHGMRCAARTPLPHAKVCLRHGLTYVQHIILHEAGLSDNELDILTYQEILGRIHTVFDTIKPPMIYLEKQITMSELHEETNIECHHVVTMIACPDQSSDEVHVLNNKIISEASKPSEVDEPQYSSDESFEIVTTATELQMTTIDPSLLTVPPT